MFRTPLLPFDELLTWGAGLAAPTSLDDPARLEEALVEDRKTLRSRLRAAFARPEARDALFIASPNIIERFYLWTDDPDSEGGRKVEHVLVRYFSRMTGRATPFGLFAGCSVGALGNRTQLTIEGRDRYRRHTRLDMDYLDALTIALTGEPSLKNLFCYRPNSSLYRAAGRLRYVEARLKDKLRSYHLVAVEDTDYLSATLARAHEGAKPETLAAALVATHQVSIAEAREYISELIVSQLLVPDLVLPVTGQEPVHMLVNQLGEHAETAETAHTLERTRNELAFMDESGLGVEPERYRSLARQLESLPSKVELSRLFQVDMRKPAPDAALGDEVLGEVMRGVDLLHQLSPRSDANLLKDFQEAFVARYDTREVPLVEALDEEIGVGFGTSNDTSPLLKDLLFPSPPEESRLHNKRRYELLLRKLSEALRSSITEIALTQEELDAVSDKNPMPLPAAFAATARLSASSQAALDGGEFQLLIDGVFGPSGAGMLGRFCHADETLHQHVLSHLRDEESLQPEAVFAEIVHLPEGRIGNVISRPVLRDYEIPYLGCSGANADRQLPITDLCVSVRAGRIRLRSVRLNREVFPRLTNAHNYAWNSPGVYRFLCMISHQGVAGGLKWDWGALAVAPFLPRVTSGRLVLTLARWRVNKIELRPFAAQDGATRYQALQKWRKARNLPRLVVLADEDNRLPIDFDNALSVDSVIQLIKERDETILIELFPAPDHLYARGPEGLYTNELVVPFVLRNGKRQDPATQEDSGAQDYLSPRPGVRGFSRRFPPGSEWLYVKLYTGMATADALLRDVVRPLTESLSQSDAADQWFFTRYGDPEWHLRLRFHGKPERLHSEVIPALHTIHAPLLDDGRVWRMQFDTYEREVERYGGPDGIVLAEQLFHADSEAALEIIEMLAPGDAGADERWRLTLYAIDLLMTDFGFDLEGKCAVLRRARDAFAAEFDTDKNLWGQLREKSRKERRSLEALLERAHADEHPLAPGFAVLHRRSEHLIPIIASLRACEEAGRLSVSIVTLIMSYIHMQANRLLRSAARRQELVIYDLLTRLYESQLKRIKPL